MTIIDKIENIAGLEAKEKYNILLKFINKILTNLNENSIEDITLFKNIKKIDLEKDIIKQIFNDMKDEFEEKFEKFSYVLNNIKKENSLLVYLKYMCNSLKLELITSRVTKRVGKKTISYAMYSIELNL